MGQYKEEAEAFDIPLNLSVLSVSSVVSLFFIGKVGPTMHYEFIAILDAEIPLAVDPIFQHVLQTYASETNKTVSMWRAVPDIVITLNGTRLLK